jgi:hypothetical protein
MPGDASTGGGATARTTRRRQDPNLVADRPAGMSDAAILRRLRGGAALPEPHLTDVYVHQYYGRYDYANLGFK